MAVVFAYIDQNPVIFHLCHGLDKIVHDKLGVKIQPLLLADRSFGRASLIRFAQQMPNHTGYPVGDVVVQSSDYRGTIGCAKAGSTSGRKLSTAQMAR